MIERLKRNKFLRKWLMPVYNATIRRYKNSYAAYLFRNEKAFPPLEGEPVEIVWVFVDRDGFLSFEGGKTKDTTLEALLARFPDADWFGFIERDAIFSDRTINAIQFSFRDYPDGDCFYGDTDHIGEKNRRTDPWFKPDFNIHTFRLENLFRPLCVVKRSVLNRVCQALSGGDFDWADFTMRIAEVAANIVHIPQVLSHIVRSETIRTANPDRIEAEHIALLHHLQRADLRAEILPLKGYPFRRIRFRPKTQPLVSIIIPNKDQATMLRRCVASIRERTTYPHYELLIIENNSTTPEIEALYAEYEADPTFPGRVLRYPEQFNYSLINNWGVERSKGELVLFLNNDTEVLSTAWLEEMVSLALLPDVGMVGAKLLFPDRTIQHAGVGLWNSGERWTYHAYEWKKENSPVYYGATRKVMPVLAVTGACMMVRRSEFDAVGGFAGSLPVVYNDVDLCFKLVNNGLTNLLTPFARLIHYESATRGTNLNESQLSKVHQNYALLRSCHEAIFAKPDPYFSPNLTFDQYYFDAIR